jgi:hypothetical protein
MWFVAVRKRLTTWRVQFVLVKAKWFAPVFIPVSGERCPAESSPLAGEMV